MALVTPTPETRNPLPVGQYLVTLEPERIRDFDDWLALYLPKGLVRIVARHSEPHLFGGTTDHVTFEVLAPGKALWWVNLFGAPLNLTNAARVPEPVSDYVNEKAHAAEKAVETAVSAASSIAPLVVLVAVLYLTSELKGKRHVLL